MSEDKCLSIFSPQMETIVFIIFQIFCARHAVLSRDVFRPIARGRKDLMGYNPEYILAILLLGTE